MRKKKVVFICLGNICRSPSAEAVLKKLIKNEHLENHIEVDSAGTLDYHQGEPADSRMQKHAANRGYKLDHLARQFIPSKDFPEADYIITMDNDNYRNMKALDFSNKFSSKIFKMSAFANSIKFTEVPDPYYRGPEGFEEVLDILEDACKLLLEKIKDDIRQENQRSN